VTDRQELIRQAFAALDQGDAMPLHDLFEPDAKWIGIPRGADPADAPTCANRSAIVDVLERHHANGRRFELGKMIESGDRVAVEVTVLAPEWSGPVTTFRVFSFTPDANAVVRLNDCVDESYALQVLAA
jgi:ketosteroid isomerase-like protein